MAKSVHISTATDISYSDGRMSQRRLPAFGSYVAFAVTLFLLILVVGSGVFFFSMRQIIRGNKGRELVKLLELERIKLENYVDKEIAIVLKMASSPLIRYYFEEPNNPEFQRYAREEIDDYRYILMGSVFWISDVDKMFYYDSHEPFKLDTELPENYWYPMTLYNTDNYNFNINYNPDLNVTNLWVNVPVLGSEDKPVGILGAGINLSSFIGAIFEHYTMIDSRNRPFLYFFNEDGEITGAEDVELAYTKKNISEYLKDEIDIHVISKIKSLKPNEAYTFSARSGQAAVIFIPALDWYAVALQPDNISDYNTPLTVFFIVGLLIVALILVLSNIFIADLLVPLRETMASLTAASKAKSDFLAKMSHEIRTPMNAILGVAQIQQEKENLPEETKSAFDIISHSSMTLLSIINDILDMSKIETGKLTLNPIEYDVPSLICDVVQLNVTRVDSKPVDFKLLVDENLPVVLFGDDLRVKQILNNILSNSFKYTGEGSINLSITHAADIDGNTALTFKVTDTGQGIREEDLKELFSEYLRLNIDINRNVEGTGLGLNIVRRLVTMMDGWIDVESEYGKGSTFTVTVRQKMVLGAGIIGAEYSKKLQDFCFAGIMRRDDKHIDRTPMPHGSVLVVDDVETNLLIAEMLLTPYELKIEKATSGPVAIEKIKNGKTYDIVFMDHMMPEMDGIEAAAELRAYGYGGIIVALTANAIVGNREMFISNGFDDFLSKPVSVQELDEILNKYIHCKYSDEDVDAPADQTGAPIEAKVLTPPRSAPIKMNERFLDALKRDVTKSIAMMRETVASGDIKLFTTAAHGLKSVLAAVGEYEKSELALALETAGRNDDMEFISVNIDKFITTLEELVENG
ncbi:MAG: response regulator [Chitinispirillales bacterium]|jgi:signal transduction histidine kinase/CheY-like chemotaxis protein|nr:response regulator [Chitinispirillales bacterium]